MALGGDEFFGDSEEQFRALLERDLQNMMRYASEQHGRSQQVEIGPSEIGNECPRSLAYKLAGVKAVEQQSDPLPSIIGVAAHAWMEDAIALWNEQLGRVRHISEQKVSWRQNHPPGTWDGYDVDAPTVLDWKFPGVTRFKLYTSKGPSNLYRTQVHTYGLGYERTFNLPVRRVGIFFVPRAGRLRDAHLWVEPYNREIAELAVARIEAVEETNRELDVVNHPEHFSLIPACPSAECQYCEQWTPNPKGPLECPGPIEEQQSIGPIEAIHKLQEQMRKEHGE